MASPRVEILPRLMGEADAARYLGVSPSKLRELPVERRVVSPDCKLYDRLDLDDLITAFEEREPNSCDEVFFDDDPEGLRMVYYEEAIADMREGRHPLPLPVSPADIPHDTVIAWREPIPADVERAVWERDWRQCRYCGTTRAALTIDHVVPVCRGGPNTLENLVVCCVSCNSSKGTKTLYSEWIPPCMERVN